MSARKVSLVPRKPRIDDQLKKFAMRIVETLSARDIQVIGE
jgi:hypothetical protein